jgi:hypothetical protein
MLLRYLPVRRCRPPPPGVDYLLSPRCRPATGNRDLAIALLDNVKPDDPGEQDGTLQCAQCLGGGTYRQRQSTSSLADTPLSGVFWSVPWKRHEIEIDLDDIVVRQAPTRRSDKINMSRGVRPYSRFLLLLPQITFPGDGGAWLLRAAEVTEGFPELEQVGCGQVAQGGRRTADDGLRLLHRVAAFCSELHCLPPEIAGVRPA